MSNEFRREDRYIVIKNTDADKASPETRRAFSVACRKLHDSMLTRGAPARSFLVIESDWPEYEPAWAEIEARMTGEAPKPPALGEEPEILGYSVKGNPYAIRLTKGELLELYEGYKGDALIELIDRAHLAPLQAEIERHKANAEEWEKASLHWMAERDQLKAQRDEAMALLREVAKKPWLYDVIGSVREFITLSKPAGSDQAPPLEIPSRTITLSGCEFTEDELLRRAVRAVRGKRRNTYPRWALVRDAFGCGSGVGTALCRRFGFDPEEVLKS